MKAEPSISSSRSPGPISGSLRGVGIGRSAPQDEALVAIAAFDVADFGIDGEPDARMAEGAAAAVAGDAGARHDLGLGLGVGGVGGHGGSCSFGVSRLARIIAATMGRTMGAARRTGGRPSRGVGDRKSVV